MPDSSKFVERFPILKNRSGMFKLVGGLLLLLSFIAEKRFKEEYESEDSKVENARRDLHLHERLWRIDYMLRSSRNELPKDKTEDAVKDLAQARQLLLETQARIEQDESDLRFLQRFIFTFPSGSSGDDRLEREYLESQRIMGRLTELAKDAAENVQKARGSKADAEVQEAKRKTEALVGEYESHAPRASERGARIKGLMNDRLITAQQDVKRLKSRKDLSGILFIVFGVVGLVLVLRGDFLEHSKTDGKAEGQQKPNPIQS